LCGELWGILVLWRNDQIAMLIVTRREILMMAVSRKGVRTVTVALPPVALEQAPVALETALGMAMALATRKRILQMKTRKMMTRRMNVVAMTRTVLRNHGRDVK